MTRRVQIFNCAFDAFTMRETVDAVFAAIRDRSRGWLATVNVSTLVAMRHSAPLQRYVDRAKFVVADGQPLVWCAPLFDGRIPERVTGIDLTYELCERAAAEGVGVYLLGSTTALVSKAAQALGERYPALQIGSADGYFGAEKAAARADAVRASAAAILLVGMGSPRQEAFIENQWERLGVSMAIGVGGSFDVIAGARYRAHPLLRRIGMEWVVRLLQEPRRLLPRYAVSNLAFARLLVAHISAPVVNRLLVSKESTPTRLIAVILACVALVLCAAVATLRDRSPRSPEGWLKSEVQECAKAQEALAKSVATGTRASSYRATVREKCEGLPLR